MQKKIACVNDISGVGKCSLTVAIPIISALKCQCCPLPTSVLSSQTGYPKFTFVDLTDYMDEYIDTWNELGKKMDTVYSGFLGSVSQIQTVQKLISINPGANVIVDPVLGDNGVLFPIFDYRFVKEMTDLVTHADIITPNITEANLLVGYPVDMEHKDEESLLDLCRKLVELGPEHIIITGYIKDDMIYNITYNKGDAEVMKIGNRYNNVSFSGTGDIFTSIISALITRDFEIEKSVRIASDFISTVVGNTSSKEYYDRNDGVDFEDSLSMLTSI